MAGKQQVEKLESSGGVVYRTKERGVEVLLCGRNSPLIWALPKGTPEPGESREQTAAREVGEETGLNVETDRFIGNIQYWFTRPTDRARCHKTVYFYLMNVTGGDVTRHDREFDRVQWFPLNEALKAMTYENEAKIVEKGLSMAQR
jgi:8-oxo-dGTP pyrophosphatase MutT (NUDIX family)